MKGHIRTVKTALGLILFKASFLSLLFLLINHSVSGQSHANNSKADTTTTSELIIKGVVKAKGENTPLSDIYVYSRELSEGVHTDANGQFQFPKKLKKGYRLLFYADGVDNVEYIVGENSQNIEIQMNRNNTHCGLREVEQPKSKKKKKCSK